VIRLETRFTVARKSTYEDAAVEAEKRLKGTFVIDFVRDGVAGAPGVPTYEAA
jgi:hypothetical protein